MHEMGIACSILDAVRSEAAKHPGSYPSKVGLRLGEWAGVDVESLRFSFEALTIDTDLLGLQLEIEYRLRRNRCTPCGLEFRVERLEFACPRCGSRDSVPVSGEELEIAFVELENEAGGSHGTSLVGEKSSQ